jgi:hypothetical protein
MRLDSQSASTAKDTAAGEQNDLHAGEYRRGLFVAAVEKGENKVTDILSLSILSVAACALIGLLLWLAFVAVRGMVRYYRDNKPRPMATPWRDPRDATAMHWRIVNRRGK